MKSILKSTCLSLLLMLIAFNFSLAQSKMLTLDDAVMASRRGLVPAKPEQLQWIGKTTEFAYVNKESGIDILVTGTPDGKSYTEVFYISKFNSILNENGIDTSATFPTITWLDKNRFYFINKNQILEFNISTSKVNKLLEENGKEIENKETELVIDDLGNKIWTSNELLAYKRSEKYNSDIYSVKIPINNITI